MDFINFSRVLINSHGDAVTPARAEDLGIVPEIGFLRKDGWSLACPLVFKEKAHSLWEDEWTFFIKKGDVKWSPISEYTND